MAKKFLVDIDLGGQQILNARIENSATAPENPSVGQIYFNTTDGKNYVWNGTEWVDNTYELPIASADTLGGVKIGEGLTIDSTTGVVDVDDPDWSDIQNKPSSLGTPITGATKTKITYDSNGLVTAGADLAASDIPDLSDTYVAKNTAITGATKTKITYDAKGLVTGGADLAASDIPDLSATYVAKNTDITGATKTKITYDAKGLVTAGADLEATDIPALPLTKISDVTATATEVNYLSGVTSAVQTQLNDKLDKNTAITGATKTKITYDANGLVTAGADLAASDIPDLSATYVAVTEKGANNGVATLNNSGKLTQTQIPDGLLGNVKYGGTFDATGACTLVDGEIVDIEGTVVTSLTIAANNPTNYKGYYFIATADGTVAGIEFKTGDWCISNGSVGWAKIDNTDAVTGIKGNEESTYRIGNVNITAANVGAVEANAAITGATKAKITYDSKGLVTAGEDLTASDIPDLSATYVTTNTAITGATKTKITYDAKGLVTAGADLAASDIPDLSATYVANQQAAADHDKFLVTNGSGVVTPTLLTRTYIHTHTQGVTGDFTVVNPFNNSLILVQVIDATTGDVVITDVNITSSTVSIGMSTNAATGNYAVILYNTLNNNLGN